MLIIVHANAKIVKKHDPLVLLGFFVTCSSFVPCAGVAKSAWKSYHKNKQFLFSFFFKKKMV